MNEQLQERTLGMTLFTMPGKKLVYGMRSHAFTPSP